MTSKSLRLIFLIVICLPLLTHSKNCFADTIELNKYNTSITIHYDKEEDLDFLRLQQYDKYGFIDNLINAIPGIRETSGKLKKTVEFALSQPLVFLIDFNQFYIEPNEHVDVNYSILKNTIDEFENSFKINKGNIIQLSNNGMRIHPVRISFQTNSKYLIKADVEDYLDLKLAKEKSFSKATEFLSQVSNAPITLKRVSFFEQYNLDFYFASLTNYLKDEIKSMEADMKNFTKAKMIAFAKYLSAYSIQKERPYWTAMKNVYEITYADTFSGNSINEILEELNDYDSITKQYFLLWTLKNKEDVTDSELHLFTGQITFPGFQDQLRIIKEGGKGILTDEALKKAVLFNYDMQKISFNDLFEKTTQKYVFLDFSGSWCPPCIEDMTEYVKTKKFDSSLILKPIWLFFENNKTDWLKVIDRLGLKKENCYLVLDDEIISNYFSINLYWQGKFPHYFLFDNKGKTINSNAESLNKLVLPVESGPPPPPLPPGN